MIYKKLRDEFIKKFKLNHINSPKKIGLECEIPLVTQQGEAVKFEVIEGMFKYLEKNGFYLKYDHPTNQIIEATRKNKTLSSGYTMDSIKTELGFSTLEIALAPYKNLHLVQKNLSELLNLLLTYFDNKNCRMLGYGIQPITPPSDKLLVPHKRYNFIDRSSNNHFIPKTDGKDFHLLTITASNQCHIDVSLKDAILATNVLNAFSGLQIALHANSPIWNGKIDIESRASREFFWHYCFPDRLHQMGIPRKFKNINDYIEALMTFKCQRVLRNNLPYRIVTNKTFKEFLENTSSTIGESRDGLLKVIHPKIEDIHLINAFCYYNARLATTYGTIESRMCCQQPPNETLTTPALTLGILENLQEAEALMNTFDWDEWKALRLDAIKNTFHAKINNQSILPILSKLLDISEKGLKNRGLGEEKFLQPLYERLNKIQSPANVAIDIFKNQGIEAFLNQFSFTKNNSIKNNESNAQHLR